MLYKIESSKPLRETNGNIDANPIFAKYNDRVLRYVFLMFDYDSPYRRMPMEARKHHVLNACSVVDEKSKEDFFKSNEGHVHILKKEFTKLQFDVERESLLSCREQMMEWNELLSKKDKSDREQVLAHKVFKDLPDFMERLKKIEEIVGEREVYNDAEDVESTDLEDYLEELNEIGHDS